MGELERIEREEEDLEEASELEKRRADYLVMASDVERFLMWKPVALLLDAAFYIAVVYLLVVIVLWHLGFLPLEAWFVK